MGWTVSPLHQGLRIEQKGCVAHIVRLAENQRFSKFDPRGVDFRIYLIINETNNVCNAPEFPPKKKPTS